MAEEWNEYMLEDGTRVRIKSTLTKVSRTDKFNIKGEPIYLVEGSNMLEIKSPKRGS
jgi:hypothetical protein